VKNVLNGFKEFITRGNVIDLAVGIVIGAAFAAVIDSLVRGFINPLIAMLFSKPNLASTMSFEINNAQFSFGLILGELINFLAIAAAVYFFVVLPINHLQRLRKRGEVAEPQAPAEDVILLQEIRDLLAAQSGRGPGQTTTPKTPPTPPTGY
jgi:large conductance mechanosensitive channel